MELLGVAWSCAAASQVDAQEFAARKTNLFWPVGVASMIDVVNYYGVFGFDDLVDYSVDPSSSGV